MTFFKKKEAFNLPHPVSGCFTECPVHVFIQILALYHNLLLSIPIECLYLNILH